MTISSSRIHAALFALTFLPRAYADSVDFESCLQEIRDGLWGTTGGTTNTGDPISNISLATSITYTLCVTACGAGPTPFSWSTFSQQLGSWLLPWLALLSQLPFGTNNLFQNFLSVLLAVGSPTLAAFSLTATVLDARWIVKRFTTSDAIRKHRNSHNAMKALLSLHQAPLIVTSSPSLLYSLTSSKPGYEAEASKWLSELVQWLDYTHPVTWSLSAVTSIAWVVIAYAFTVIDSLQGDITQWISAHGQGIGSIWMWLLPVVSGWLQLSPKCDSGCLYRAIPHANSRAYRAAMTSDVHGGTSHGKSESYEMEEIELEMKSSSSSLDGPDVIREQAFRLAVAGQGEYTSLRCDELWTAPIYNYARFFSWAQSVERVARAFEVASARTKLDRLSLELEGNDREELKELVEVEFEDVEATTSVLSTRWAPGIFSRFFIASFLALVLQWGTTGAAMIVNYFTPAYGIGCRTASYLLYGALGTLSWGLLMLSAFLSHYSTTTASSNPQAFQGPHTSRRRRTPKPNRSGGSMTATCIRRLSIALRIIGKTLAYANAIWILVACIFQFTNFYDRCWCNSSVISLGVSRAYYVIEISWDEVPAMRLYWIAGVTVAAGSATLYAAFNQLFPSS